MARPRFTISTKLNEPLLPQRIGEDLAEDSPSRIINSVVDYLDLGKIFAFYSDQLPVHG